MDNKRLRGLALQVMEGAPVVVRVLDLEGRIQHINPFFERLSGHRLGDVIGADWFAIALPERDSERARSRFRRSLGGELMRSEVSAIVTRAGAERRILWSEELLRDEEGRTTGILAMGHDVTEGAFAEDRAGAVVAEDREPARPEGKIDVTAELLEARTRLQNVLDSLFVFVALYDLEGRRMEVNRCPLDALGARREAVVGASFWEGYTWSPTPETQAQARSAFLRAAAGEPVREEFVVHISEGRVMTVDGMFAPLRDAGGRIIGVVGSAVDITERKIAKAKIREREARLAAIFNNTSDAMGLFSVDADGELRLEAANRLFVVRAGQFAEVTEADLIGRTLRHLVLELYEGPADIFEQYQTSLKRAIETRSPVNFEHSVVYPSGTIFAEVTLVPIMDPTNKCTQVLWSARDVTIRKQADAQMRAAMAEKEALVREVHHRVKNNLQVISSLLHFQGKKHPSPESVAAFAEIRQRILALTLVHDRLYQSKDVTRVDFADYARSLVAALGRTFESTGEARPGVRIHVDVDDVQLPIEIALPCGMAVCELLTNVYKYAYPGGICGAATLSVRRAGDHVELKVDDDGVGFPAGFDSATQASFGWELLRALTMQLDGTLEATSDHGAHVRLTFPIPEGA